MKQTSVKTLTINPKENTAGTVYLRRAMDALAPTVPQYYYTTGCRKTVKMINHLFPTRRTNFWLSAFTFFMRLLLASAMIWCGVETIPMAAGYVILCLCPFIVAGAFSRPVSILSIPIALWCLFAGIMSVELIISVSSVAFFACVIGSIGPGWFSLDALWRIEWVKKVRLASKYRLM